MTLQSQALTISCSEESGESLLVRLKITCVDTSLSLRKKATVPGSASVPCVKCSYSNTFNLLLYYLQSSRSTEGELPASHVCCCSLTFSPSDGDVYHGVQILLGPRGMGIFSSFRKRNFYAMHCDQSLLFYFNYVKHSEGEEQK